MVEEGRGNDFVADSIDGWIIKYTNVRFLLYNIIGIMILYIYKKDVTNNLVCIVL